MPKPSPQRIKNPTTPDALKRVQTKQASNPSRDRAAQAERMKEALQARPDAKRATTPTNADRRSRQLNPNNPAYWQSRQLPERPADWHERINPS